MSYRDRLASLGNNIRQKSHVGYRFKVVSCRWTNVEVLTRTLSILLEVVKDTGSDTQVSTPIKDIMVYIQNGIMYIIFLNTLLENLSMILKDKSDEIFYIDTHMDLCTWLLSMMITLKKIEYSEMDESVENRISSMYIPSRYGCIYSSRDKSYHYNFPDPRDYKRFVDTYL